MSLCSLVRLLVVPKRHKNDFSFAQGNVEKVVVVIKDKDEVALERFIFSVQNMIAVESFNKDTRSNSLTRPCYMSP
jgi:mitotic spindle assembly checkpoint protein MAD2B